MAHPIGILITPAAPYFCLLAHHAVSAGRSKAAVSAEGSHALTAVVQSPAFESAAEVSYSASFHAFVTAFISKFCLTTMHKWHIVDVRSTVP
jgi:uncharacterized membrane protein (GlpM family)